jgi:hypothetical protein
VEATAAPPLVLPASDSNPPPDTIAEVSAGKAATDAAAAPPQPAPQASSMSSLVLTPWEFTEGALGFKQTIKE